MEAVALLTLARIPNSVIGQAVATTDACATFGTCANNSGGTLLTVPTFVDAVLASNLQDIETFGLLGLCQPKLVAEHSLSAVSASAHGGAIKVLSARKKTISPFSPPLGRQ